MSGSGAKVHGKAVEISPHQSAWLTHWTGTSSTHDQLTQLNDHDIKKHKSGVKKAADEFGYSKGVDLTMSLKKPSSQSFPFFKIGQEQGESKGLQRLGSQVSHKNLTSDFNVETLSREFHRQPIEEVKYHMFFGESNYACSRPSDQGEYKVDNHTTRRPANFQYLTSAFDSKDYLPENEKSEMASFLRHNNTSYLKTGPSTSSHHSPSLVEEQYKRMQNHIGMGLFPHQTGSPQKAKPETMHHGECSFQNVPHFVHDVEMTRMCSPINSAEILAGGIHSFSRTTHSLLITKQTDVKVYRESQIYRESRVSTHHRGEALRELNHSPPDFAQGQQGLKIQLLDSSDDHESHENTEDVKDVQKNELSAVENVKYVQKNESSADTDTMDMESFKDNRLSGVRLSPPNKDLMVESNKPPLPLFGLSAEKDTRNKRKVELPDMNIEISAQPAASSSTDNAEPCTSRTQSLDMNTLQFNLDRTGKSNSNECSNSNLGSEPGSRWIKRLKLNASSSHALGTKFSKMAEPSSQGKLNKLFYGVLDKRHGKRSESLMGESHHKRSEIQIGECTGKGDSSSVETKQECKEITLSNSWIQRWSHNQNRKNPDTVETCKQENSKLATDELQKKQFPSIAAMALMGKAMTGFQQCKFQKRESFVVWNAKTFEDL
uniref:uncharacterized protein LOC122599512 n=1 Tax=Erigeron canadensis TaxID=72917 RepID=UPI001CB90A11|nr:uncharacterized protein LOC122599512 [Erigeron canadensis]